MAEIKPLRAWRYNRELCKNIGTCISPLFDVVSDQQRSILYNNPYNSIHLSVPKGPDAAKTAAKTLSTWKESKIIEQDYLPGIYIYYQYFNLPGHQRTYCRKGFVCFIKAYDWDEEVVLRHENTIPPAVEDRVALLKRTELNASATHGLYSDPEFQLEQIMDECMTDPILETEDYQGVREVLSVVHDARAIRQFVKVLKNQQIILADGHHRYQGSINYRKYRREQNPHHTGEEGYNYHMMFLTNMEAKDLRILATHRLVKGLPTISEEAFIEKASEFFQVYPVDVPLDINEIILGKKATFGVVMRNQTFKLTLKTGLEDKIDWPFPDLIKELDLTLLHYYILEKIWGIKGKDQRSSSHIIYDRNFTDCVTRVHEKESQMAIITNELNMEDIKKVCFSGYTLPQKSTYFYPKAVCGLLFGSIKEDEFQYSDYPGF
jgi:uncharacterized protein (DUF1015 family)